MNGGRGEEKGRGGKTVVVGDKRCDEECNEKVIYRVKRGGKVKKKLLRSVMRCSCCAGVWGVGDQKYLNSPRREAPLLGTL